MNWSRRDFHLAMGTLVAGCGLDEASSTTANTAAPVPGTASAPTALSTGQPPLLQIGMLLYPGFTAQDFVGPQLAFAFIGDVQIHILWKELTAVRSDSGYGILPDTVLSDCPADLDILFVPRGGRPALRVSRGESLGVPAPPADLGRDPLGAARRRRSESDHRRGCHVGPRLRTLRRREAPWRPSSQGAATLDPVRPGAAVRCRQSRGRGRSTDSGSAAARRAERGRARDRCDRGAGATQALNSSGAADGATRRPLTMTSSRPSSVTWRTRR